jgi:hypothetical protein
MGGMARTALKQYLPLVGALLVAALLIVLHGWGIEETWIKPSLVPREEGAAGVAGQDTKSGAPRGAEGRRG